MESRRDTDESDYLEIKTRTGPRRERPRCDPNELAEQVHGWHERGELRHLHGRPLDLSDDSPDWFIRKTLKREGFSHPLLERAREIDQAEDEAASILERLGRRRDWLTRPETNPTARQVHDFNQMRAYDLERYRDKLTRLNRLIRDYNLTVPDSMQRRPYRVDDVVAGVQSQVPPLDLPSPEVRPHSRSGGRSWRAWVRRIAGRSVRIPERTGTDVHHCPHPNP